MSISSFIISKNHLFSSSVRKTVIFHSLRLTYFIYIPFFSSPSKAKDCVTNNLEQQGKMRMSKRREHDNMKIV